jgi:UDPglucose--hexose-1-phosphate uridylyltransferase
VWVAPRRQTPDFAGLSAAQRREVARAMLTVLRKYDALWNKPFPYIMVWYQAPRLEGCQASCHLHAEFFPPYRMPERLKYLAGTEIGAGLYANDALPEDKAAELQAVEVSVE